MVTNTTVQVHITVHSFLFLTDSNAGEVYVGQLGKPESLIGYTAQRPTVWQPGDSNAYQVPYYSPAFRGRGTTPTFEAGRDYGFGTVLKLWNGLVIITNPYEQGTSESSTVAGAIYIIDTKSTSAKNMQRFTSMDARNGGEEKSTCCQETKAYVMKNRARLPEITCTVPGIQF